MVSFRCKMVVKDELCKLGVPYTTFELGFVELGESITADLRQLFIFFLMVYGLELLDDKKSILTERIKNAITEIIHSPEDTPKVNYSTYLSKKLGYYYTYLSNTFKEERGITINQYIVNIPGKLILGDRPEGDYLIGMVGQTESGHSGRKETNSKIVKWTPPSTEEAMRFSVIYEFDDAKAITSYEKHLTETVAPKIKKGPTVNIYGHTDVIGEEAYNKGLSLARANDVKTILEKSLLKAGTTGVKFDIQSMGEDERVSPFKNEFPEERAYNRTVIMDVIPGK